MTEGLVKKRRIRAGHKGVVSKRLGEVTKILEPGEDGGAPDLVKLAQLKLALTEKLAVLKQLDTEILDMLDAEADITTEIEASDTFNQGIYETLVRIDESLREASPRVTPPVGTPTGRFGLEGGAAMTTAHSKAKLPKLTLNRFDGSLINWTPFWDSFKAAIHTNPNISNVDKFNYLQSLVDNSAKDAISGLALTEANYDEAVAILEKRFGNKQLIIGKHMEILLNAESVSSATHVQALRKLYDKVESNVRGLASLGVAAETYGSLLSSVLVQKLPSELRLMISRKVADEWTLQEIMKILGEELEARERAATTRNDHATPNPSSGRGSTSRPTSTALLSGSKSNESPVGCCYCQRTDHTADLCLRVGSVKERKQILKGSGRCFMCTRKGHISRNCRSKSRCQKCGGKHHTTICEQSFMSGGGHSSKPVVSQTSEASNPEASSSSGTTCCHVSSDQTILLQTARVTVFNPLDSSKGQEISVILDTGSQKSYITKSVVDKLGLRSRGRKVMSIMTFGSKESKPQQCDLTEVGLALKSGTTRKMSVLTIPLICESMVSTTADICIDDPRSISLMDVSSKSTLVKPDLLIGMDHYWTLVSGELIQCSDGFVALNTQLGWVLSGPIPVISHIPHSANLVTHVLRADTTPAELDRQLDRQLRKFWDLESLGIVDKECTIHEQFTEVIQFRNGRYEVPLPWKDPSTLIPDNYQMSQKRLLSLLQRLRRCPEVLSQYDDIMKEQLRMGIIVPVDESPEGDPQARGRIHYLPHHAVVRHDKETTKVRVVYDASAKSQGPSLNDCLHVGPKFNQRIFDILLRFRAQKTALVADIEKAFLMIAINEEDQDVLRFLWVRDIKKEPPDIQTFRFTRVVFGVASSPFLLNATIHYHLQRYMNEQPRLVSQLIRSTYVDDVICGARDEGRAYYLFNQAKGIFQEGGFNLRKFVTNDPILQGKINESEGIQQTPMYHEGYTQLTLGPSQLVMGGERKVLGLRWNTHSDEIILDPGDLFNLGSRLKPTKREVVSLVGRFYDPLGILSPVVIRFKVFLQVLSQLKQPWDQVLTGKALSEWTTLLKGLETEGPIRLPRFYQLKPDTPCRLYGFCDASARAYAAVVYVASVSDHQATPQLVCCKTRVSPLKELTIPRLELLSTVLLARLIHSVTEALSTELDLEEPICYTDSMIAYHWIKGLDKGWKPFIQNRVNEVRRLVPPIRWKHCPGELNPADIPSRGKTLQELSSNTMWFHGPDWLCRPSLDSEELSGSEMPEECLLELQMKTCNLLTITPHSVAKSIDLKAHSDIDHLLRITAYVQLFVKRVKGSVVESFHGLVCSSETLWVIDTQQSLESNKQFKNWKSQLNLFKDPDGVWRCGGRLHHAKVPYSTKFPVLLPSNHHFTTLIIRRAHNRVFHNGVKETLTEVRSKYWILRGRAVVRQFIHHCRTCRRFESLSCSAPPPPLPPFRVQEEPPFTHTGVDFAGPLYIKTSSSVEEKVWICIYTCCVVRAIHLEIVPDLSTQSFLRCFKRFAARRGLPRRMVSDNGKTFKSAAKTLKSIMTDKRVVSELAGRKVEWVFNIERAPWWGGIFERMVRSTKRCLKKMIGRSKLSHDELLTILTEVEAIINSRPLSYVSPSDSEEPLTPSHLLVGRRILSLPDGHYYKREEDETYNVTPETLNKRMVFLNDLMQRFWVRWKAEYLLELRNSHKYKTRGQEQRIAEGDVVLVHDDQLKRGFWKTGLVTDIIPGRDGVIRGAVVKVCSGEKCTLLRRPIQRLYLLETNSLRSCGLDDTNEDMVNNGDCETPSDSSSNPTPENAVSLPKERSEIENDEVIVDNVCQGGSPREASVISVTDTNESTHRRQPTRNAARMARSLIKAQAIDSLI